MQKHWEPGFLYELLELAFFRLVRGVVTIGGTLLSQHILTEYLPRVTPCANCRGYTGAKSPTLTEPRAGVSKVDSLHISMGKILSLFMLFLFVYKLCNVLLAILCASYKIN